VLPLSSALMMETARTSETSVDIQLRTRHYIPEDSELRTRLPEKLKSHTAMLVASDLMYFIEYKCGGSIKSGCKDRTLVTPGAGLAQAV
jgi:hypothetical protein